jgi:PAS domain S-box-containing protein
MSILLRVLYIEDQSDDVRLMEQELRRDGFEPVGVRVESEEELLAHLDNSLDAILADFTLPGFNGLEALRLVRRRGLDVPFLFVSGTLGEEQAIRTLHEGADDYLLKDRLARLGPAVRQAMERRHLRAARRQAEEQAAHLAAVVRSCDDAIVAMSLEGVIRSWNPAAQRLHGYSADEVLGRPISLVVPPERLDELAGVLRRIADGEHVPTFETLWLRKVGLSSSENRSDVFPMSVTCSPINDAEGRVVGASLVSRTIAAQPPELPFRRLVEEAPIGLHVIQDDRFRYVNRRLAETFAYRPEELTSLSSWLDLVAQEDRTHAAEQVGRLTRAAPIARFSFRGLRKDGTALAVEVHGTHLRYEGRPAFLGCLLATGSMTR